MFLSLSLTQNYIKSIDYYYHRDNNNDDDNNDNLQRFGNGKFNYKNIYRMFVRLIHITFIRLFGRFPLFPPPPNRKILKII